MRIKPSADESTARWLLKGGARYRVTASGVWRNGHGKHARADAMCTKSGEGWTRSGGGLSIGGDQLRGWGLTWEPAHDNGNGCDTRTHTYRLVLQPLLPSTVHLQLDDSSPADDHGSVRVRFDRVA
jgi:hypothetical protein